MCAMGCRVLTVGGIPDIALQVVGHTLYSPQGIIQLAPPCLTNHLSHIPQERLQYAMLGIAHNQRLSCESGSACIDLVRSLCH